MNRREPDFSRRSRKNRSGQSNKILNILIGVVVLLIFITAVTIFLDSKGEEKGQENEVTPVEEADLGTTDTDIDIDTPETEDDREHQSDSDEASADQPQVATSGDNTAESETVPGNNSGQEKSDADHNDVRVQELDENEKENPGTVTYVSSDDKVISETVVNTSWQPVGTTQTGNHVSLYDGESDDWKEKQKAIAYATGLPEDGMIFWKIKNGGGPQKSVGVVSSKDKAQKYQVYIEWVDGEGWKPVKMDILNTLDFDY